MKFKSFCYFFLLVTTAVPYRSGTTAYRSQENLYGKVKSITFFTYHATEKDGKLEKGAFAFPYKEQIRYNEKGNRITEESYGDVIPSFITERKIKYFSRPSNHYWNLQPIRYFWALD